jgi:peptide-methionine (S)-S-oxide reductase
MMENKTEVAVFGGGCFWCTEAVFNELRGVISVMPGYAGGTVKNPTYEQVSSGTTGHAEVTRVEFDPSQISFHDLLTVFFATHDPTTLNRQGNDVGTQYRSAIFYTNEAQEAEARKFITLLGADGIGRPIVTEIVALPENGFYPAEDYHREYFKNNPQAAYCRVIIEPKVEKVQEKFAELLKTHSK